MASACCPPGSMGAMDTGNNTTSYLGTMVTLSAPDAAKFKQPPPLKCYQVDPKEEATRLIFVFPDVFGIESGNHRTFCDTLQQQLSKKIPTSVWMPDLFGGTPMAPDLYGNDFWSKARITWAVLFAARTRVTVPTIRADLAEVVQPNVPSNITSIGMVGFCFGGYVVGKSLGWAVAAKEGDSKEETGSTNTNAFFPQLKAGAMIHPSWRPESVIVGGRQSLEEMATATKTIPILCVPAQEDVEFHASGAIPQQLARQRNVSVDEIVMEFLSMLHGFVSRGDSSNNEPLRQAQEQAMNRTVEFLETHL